MARDLISRAAVNELLDELCVVDTIYDKINELPTVDAVEVVRCKDCRFSDCRQSFREGETYCTISCLLVGNNEYCSNGAKMDGDKE